MANGKKYPWENKEYSAVAEKYSQYGGYPESGPQASGPAGAPIVKNEGNFRDKEVSGGDAWFRNWYDNATTRDKLKSQLGLDDKQIDQAITHGLNAEHSEEEAGEGLAGKYELGPHRITTNPGEAGQGALPHERVHASSLDNALGSILRKEIGSPSGLGDVTNYLSNDGELYGNFVDLRHLLKLEPGDWVTPELIESRLETEGIDENHPRRFEIDQMLEVYSLEDLAKGLDKIASTEADSERLERLNFTPDDFVISRPTSLYT